MDFRRGYMGLFEPMGQFSDPLTRATQADEYALWA